MDKYLTTYEKFKIITSLGEKMYGMCLMPPKNKGMNWINKLSTEIAGIRELIGGSKYTTVIIKLGDKASKLERVT